MRKKIVSFLQILLGLGLTSGVFAAPPVLPPSPEPAPVPFGARQIIPGAKWLDDKGVFINAHGGGFLPHEGVYYWYGEHKITGKDGNKAQVGVHVYSSSDLLSWKDLGIALAVSEDPQSQIAKGCVIERPKVVRNNKTNQFVMWFHLELLDRGYNAAMTGVAVADKPEGPFTFRGGVRPNAGKIPLNMPEALRAEFAALKTRDERVSWGKAHKEYERWARDFDGGQMARDMNVFVDDDGAAYQIFSSEDNRVTHISKLTPDCLAHSGEYIRAYNGSREAPAPFKSGGRYYIINSGCTGWRPNPTRVFTADSMLGAWKDLGECFGGDPALTTTSFASQPTYALPVKGKPGCFIFMGDRWRPQDPIDGRYIWLPVRWKDGKPWLEWKDNWELSIFDNPDYRDPAEKRK